MFLFLYLSYLIAAKRKLNVVGVKTYDTSSTGESETNTPAPSQKDDDKLTVGAIVSIAITGITIIVTIVIIVFIVRNIKNFEKISEEPQEEEKAEVK